jgi:hypothetical protein
MVRSKSKERRGVVKEKTVGVSRTILYTASSRSKKAYRIVRYAASGHPAAQQLVAVVYSLPSALASAEPFLKMLVVFISSFIHNYPQPITFADCLLRMHVAETENPINGNPPAFDAGATHHSLKHHNCVTCRKLWCLVERGLGILSWPLSG